MSDCFAFDEPTSAFRAGRMYPIAIALNQSYHWKGKGTGGEV